MTRVEAMAHLGLAAGANEAEIRRAFRLWARLAHPDRGGDPARFQALRQARDVLLAPVLADTVASTAPTALTRQRLREVLGPPTRSGRVLIMLALIGTLMLVWLPVVLGTAPLVVTAAPAAVAAAGTAVLARDRMLSKDADVGHRIVGLVIVWAPTVLLQVLGAQLFAVSFVPVLPLFALPFVAVVAAVNPGAGFWRRPIS
ncbi:MAG: J domain-containing protein [Candidatus Nanopelagicales bacterium]